MSSPSARESIGGVPVAPSIVLGDLDQPIDLLFGEIFPHAPTNCYIFYRRNLISVRTDLGERVAGVHVRARRPLPLR
jgi:hypothetical protein